MGKIIKRVRARQSIANHNRNIRRQIEFQECCYQSSQLRREIEEDIANTMLAKRGFIARFYDWLIEITRPKYKGTT